MTHTLIGYARCSTDKQDLAAQKDILSGLGVAPDRIYTDHGFTGTNRARPGLDQALAALRPGDTLVVPKLDRLARSVPDAREIADSLSARGVRLQLGAAVHDSETVWSRRNRKCLGASPASRRRNTRKVIVVPPAEAGGMIAWQRRVAPA